MAELAIVDDENFMTHVNHESDIMQNSIKIALTFA